MIQQVSRCTLPPHASARTKSTSPRGMHVMSAGLSMHSLRESAQGGRRSPICRACVALGRHSPNAAAAGDSGQRQVPTPLDRPGTGLGEVLMPLVPTAVS